MAQVLLYIYLFFFFQKKGVRTILSPCN